MSPNYLTGLLDYQNCRHIGDTKTRLMIYPQFFAERMEYYKIVFFNARHYLVGSSK